MGDSGVGGGDAAFAFRLSIFNRLSAVFPDAVDDFLYRQIDAVLSEDVTVTTDEAAYNVVMRVLDVSGGYPKKPKNNAVSVAKEDSDEEGEAQEQNLATSHLEVSDLTPGGDCLICFARYNIKDLVQCFEAHFYCKACVKDYAKSAIGGQGKSTLSCVAENCGLALPRSALVASLSRRDLKLLDEREQEESVRIALVDDPDLHACPLCGFKCLLPSDQRVFSCKNPTCLVETCRDCKENWTDHFGIRCSELETKDETRLRKSVEERMTATLVRFCGQCQTPMLKQDGCNKLTCRCGAKMCYLCRATIQDYKHFCDHPRDPGRGCTECTRCSLWVDPTKADDEIIERIRKQAGKLGIDPSKATAAAPTPPPITPG